MQDVRLPDGLSLAGRVSAPKLDDQTSVCSEAESPIFVPGGERPRLTFLIAEDIARWC